MPDVAAALVKDGVLSAEALTRALGAAQDGDVASAALRLGLAPENALARTLARAHGYPGVDLSRSVVPAANLSLVSAARCRACGILPISVGRGEVVVAMADPRDRMVVNEVRLLTGRHVLPHVAVRAAIEQVVDALARGAGPAWRGPAAPALPDPGAAWVGVVRGVEPVAGIDLPDTDEALELIGIAESIPPMVNPAAQARPRERAAAGAVTRPEAGATAPPASPVIAAAEIELEDAPARQAPAATPAAAPADAPETARPAAAPTGAASLASTPPSAPASQPAPSRPRRAPIPQPTTIVPAPPAAPEPTASAPAAGVRAAPHIAVVADDDPELRKLMGLVLGIMKLEMLEAADGRTALALVRERRPVLLVLDAMMPGMHGFEVCAAVKRDPELSGTRVVFCSAVYRGAAAEDARIAFGADGYLQKPFRLETAAAVLRAALGEPADAATDAAAAEAATVSWRAAAEALGKRQDDEALALARQAVAQDPVSADAHYWLGHALSRQGLLFEAVAAFERATELRPDQDIVHQCLALTYERLGFQRSARQQWAHAIQACREPRRKKAMQAHLEKLLFL